MASKRPVPPREELEGLSVSEIMKKYKASSTLVYDWIYTYSLDPPKKYPHKLYPPSKEEIEGLSCKEISEKFNVCSNTAYRWRSVRGLSASRTENRPKLTEICKALFDIKTDKEIAYLTGLTIDYVSSLRRKCEITPRVY